MFCRPGVFLEDKTGPSTAKKTEKLPSIFRVGVQASSALTINNAIIFFLQSFYPRSPPMTINIPVYVPFILTFLKRGFYYSNFFLLKNPENSSHRSLKFSALRLVSPIIQEMFLVYYRQDTIGIEITISDSLSALFIKHLKYT